MLFLIDVHKAVETANDDNFENTLVVRYRDREIDPTAQGHLRQQSLQAITKLAPLPNNTANLSATGPI